MNTTFAKTCLLAGALLLPIAAYSATGDGDSDRSHPKAFVKDSVITTKIKAELAEEKLSSLIHVKVDTDKKGAVNLSGTARSQDAIDQTVSIARGVKGVTSVKNHIKVVSDQ